MMKLEELEVAINMPVEYYKYGTLNKTDKKPLPAYST